MMPSARSLAPLGSGLTALALVLGFARVAHADECVVDTDCGHGFSCETMIVSGTGGAAGAGGSPAGGSAGTTGSGGSTAGASGSSSGGSGSGAFAPPATGGTGMGAAAGTGSAGTGSGGTGEVPVPPDYCGDGLCQTLSETVETCPEDCSNYKYCAPAACMSVSDCADGYVCAGQTRPGTGGVGGASGTGGTAGTAGTGSGAAAIICGDGLCVAPENATTCPADCGFIGQCQPQVGVCYSDANCPADYYCELMTTMGTGGGSAMGGAGGAGGSTGGFATGGTAMADPGMAGAPGGTTGSGDLVALEGVCMPRNGGVGGTGGTGMGGTGMGGDGAGGACPGGGCGAGGVTTGGTSSGVGGSMAGTSGTGAGTAGTGDAGTGPGSGGTGNGSGGSEMSSGGTGTGASMNGGSGGTSHEVVTHAGCSVSHPRNASSTGAFALFGLALAWAFRRRRAQ